MTTDNRRPVLRMESHRCSFGPKATYHVRVKLSFVGSNSTSFVVFRAYLVGYMHVTAEQPATTIVRHPGESIVHIIRICTWRGTCVRHHKLSCLAQHRAPILCYAVPGQGCLFPGPLPTIPVRRGPVFSLHVPPVELFVYPPHCLSQGPLVLHADNKEIAAYNVMYNAGSCPCFPIGDCQYIYGLDSETHVRSSHSRTLREKEKETSWEGMSLFAALVRRHEASGPVVSSGPAQVRLYLLKPDRHSVKSPCAPQNSAGVGFCSSHWRHLYGSGPGRMPFLMAQVRERDQSHIMKTVMLVERPVSEQEELPLMRNRH